MITESKSIATHSPVRQTVQRFLAGFLLALSLVLVTAPLANAKTRTLKLYFLHTKEKAEIVYWKNGRYSPAGLKKVNRFLRDWRRNEPTKMDPKLLDLVWEAYRKSGSRDYIHVVSGYRSPATNTMLRKRGRGVAKKSQHMLGRALDFYLPDVKLRKLRDIGLKMQAGGVGYYPRSGSPFVHFDVGSVRHWPRMNRKQLVAVFPKGKTLHVPTDGKPLPGYQQALASYKKRRSRGSVVQIAKADEPSSGSGRGLLSALFGGGADEEEETAPKPAATRPARRPATAVAQSPSQQPAPAEPEIVLAALPVDDIPLPIAAPRPAVAPDRRRETLTGTVEVENVPQSIPFQVIDSPPAANQTPQEVQTPVLVASDIPLPANRPQNSSGRAQLILASAGGNSDPIPRPTIMTLAALEDASQVSRAQKLLESLRPGIAADGPAVTEKPTPAATQRQNPPLPTLDTRTPDTVKVASLPQTEIKNGNLLARRSRVPIPSDRPVIESKQPRIEVRPAPLESPTSPASQRFALLERAPGTSVEIAIDTGVKTAPKSGRPGKQHRKPGPKPHIQPVTFGTSVTSWALRGYPAVDDRNSNLTAPTVSNASLSAPSSVYTAGFQPRASDQKNDKFSGRSTNFMAMVKFSDTD